MKQANLFPISQPIEPAADRREPAMWIRRLMIVESLEPDGRVIRDVTFRLGLNVIRTAERKADETRPVGHSVGKTLLFRLIRYCLGESFFSIRSVRNAIAETLPGAYVLAEICVDGEWWAVARPIGQDHSAGASKAIRGGDAEAVRAGGDEVVKFAEFTVAIEAFAGKRFIEMDFPSAGHSPRWLDLLSWLARDQHCRMRHALEWRDAESESGTAQLSREDASLLIRMVMGLLTEDERKLRERHAALLGEQTQLNRQVQLAKDRIDAVEADLCEALSIPDDSPRGSLLGPVARKAAEEKIAGLRGLVTELREKSPLGEFEAKSRDAAVALKLVEELRSRTNGKLGAARGELQQLEAADTDAFYASLVQQERWCHLFQTKDAATRRGCPGKSDELVAGTRDPRHQQRIDEVKEQIAVLTSQVATCDQELVKFQTEARRADARRQAERDRLDTQVSGVREQIGRFNLLLERSDRIGQLWDNLGRLENQLEAKAKAIEASSRKQEKAREEVAKSLGVLSRHFDATLKDLLGEDAGGQIEIDARFLHPRPSANVAATGAALGTSATVLGFDLACLIASICGLGGHPRLVLHDSPREADMEEAMYHRLFDLISRLEALFAKRPVSFQYIVTTTTPPPKAISEEPYVRLTLHARSDEGLLLRRKLVV